MTSIYIMYDQDWFLGLNGQITQITKSPVLCSLHVILGHSLSQLS